MFTTVGDANGETSTLDVDLIINNEKVKTMENKIQSIQCTKNVENNRDCYFINRM